MKINLTIGTEARTRASTVSIACASAGIVSHVNSSLAARRTSSGPRCWVRRWMIRETSGPSRIAVRICSSTCGRDRLADEEALHLDREDHGDDAEQQTDPDAAERVPPRGCP